MNLLKTPGTVTVGKWKWTRETQFSVRLQLNLTDAETKAITEHNMWGTTAIPEPPSPTVVWALGKDGTEINQNISIAMLLKGVTLVDGRFPGTGERLAIECELWLANLMRYLTPEANPARALELTSEPLRALDTNPAQPEVHKPLADRAVLNGLVQKYYGIATTAAIVLASLPLAKLLIFSGTPEILGWRRWVKLVVPIPVTLAIALGMNAALAKLFGFGMGASAKSNRLTNAVTGIEILLFIVFSNYAAMLMDPERRLYQGRFILLLRTFFGQSVREFLVRVILYSVAIFIPLFVIALINGYRRVRERHDRPTITALAVGRE